MAIHTKVLVAAVGLGALVALGSVINHDLKWSDAALTRQFLAHRADFERIVAMANVDTHLTRIAPEFTWLDNNVAWPREDVGISEQRWDRYKRLFRSVGAPVGIMHDAPTHMVIIPLVVEGLVPSGAVKGVVYSPRPLSPILHSLDKKPPAKFWNGPDRSHVLVYKPIEGHWYLYYEEW